jgi:tetratricopeptide (TPR) repeat protein/predicted Ser/Thr protein kinase
MSDGWDRSTVDMPAGGERTTNERSPSSLARRATPDRLGRYEIVEPIAGGGMGFVYAAYDPELDRKVALKVVHPRRSHNPGSHSRLIKEARALAQLDHPNVVKVHDVFSDEDQIVVVMELVNGATLEQWEAARPRTWREIVEVYAQAGEGLAAAHDLDIVHRDFKPANAIIGADGRVRVLDFGLARITKEDVADAPTEVMSGAITKTIPGTIMGTLAYAAPEQLSGGDTTASSDQFSFCAALHYALEGKRPFAGETAREIASAIQQGHPARSGRPLPNWLRALVSRGLAATPEERYLSMAALLLDLERPRGWRRWRSRALAVGSVCIAALGASAAIRQPARADDCVNGSIADVWQPAQLVRILATIDRPNVPFAEELAHRAVNTLDERAQQWTVAAHESCLAHRAATLSDPMFDRQTACLAERKAELGAAVQVLTSGTTATHATEVVSGIQTASECLDVTRVFAIEQVPIAERDRVGKLRGRLQVGAALMRAGRFEEANETLTAALADAKALQYAPVLAEAQVALGRLYIAESDHVRAGQVLRDATSTALASNLTGLAVEAIGRRIFADAQLSPDRAQFEPDYALAEPMSRAAGDPRVRALFLNNVATAYIAIGDRNRARALFRDAAATLSNHPTTDLELSAIAYNLGLMAQDSSERVHLLDEVADQRASSLGKHHPFTLEARFAAAALGDEELARRRTPEICDDYRAYRGSIPLMFAACEYRLAFLAEHAGDRAAQVDALRAALELSRIYEPLRLLIEGELALAEGQQDRAREMLSAIVKDSAGTWNLLYRAEAHHYLAKLARSTGDRKGAAENAKLELDSYRTLAENDSSLLTRIRVAEAEQQVKGDGDK